MPKAEAQRYCEVCDIVHGARSELRHRLGQAPPSVRASKLSLKPLKVARKVLRPVKKIAKAIKKATKRVQRALSGSPTPSTNGYNPIIHDTNLDVEMADPGAAAVEDAIEAARVTSKRATVEDATDEDDDEGDSLLDSEASSSDEENEDTEGIARDADDIYATWDDMWATFGMTLYFKF